LQLERIGRLSTNESMPALDAAALPQHCSLIPIFPGEPGVSLRLGAVVQTTPGKAPALVLLGSSEMAFTYLGALVDTRNVIFGWLELWVQTVGATPGLADAEAGTNPELDLRWKRWAAALLADPAVIATGKETVHPAPVWLDATAGRAVTPIDPDTGEPYELCCDDAALLAAGLDSFSESRRRFLAVRGQPGAGFVAAVGDVPAGARSPADVLPSSGTSLIPFNPEAGFLLVRRLAPLEWSQYAGLLSGQPFTGLQAGRPPVKLGGPYAPLDDWDRLQQNGAHLFSGSRGRAGRFHEAFHLKLRFFISMLRSVRTRVAATQLPQLNLGPTAFRVELATETEALPVLWSARAVITEPPATVALTAPGELRYFKATGTAPQSSIYRPEAAGHALRGKGELRIRKVTVSGGRIQIEATLVSPEVIKAAPRDLVWARLPLAGAGLLDLVGNIDAGESLAQGEARFRTGALDVSVATQAALRAAEGAIFPATAFQTIPLLSTPVDLYALAVLGVQLFLTGAKKPLATAVDDVLSLVQATRDQPETPGRAAQTLARENERWNAILGPHHHGHGMDAAEASAMLPLELWWDTVAALGRLFPGSGPRAFCQDFGDTASHQIEAAFDGPLAEFEILALRSQSLLLCDWPSNREIAHLIQKVR